MSAQWQQGPLHAVPCPNCSHPNDFRPVKEHLFNAMTDTPVTKDGLKFICDHCGAAGEVVKVERVVMVSVRS